MTLRLYFHPFASFCQKALIAFYENDIPFEGHLVDLGDERSRAAFYALWPIGRFPVLHDTARDVLLPESSIIIEYLGLHYPGPTRLVPADPDLALTARLQDRFFDLYIAEPMQKIVTDSLRTKGARDAAGVEAARSQLATAYGVAERAMASRTWAAGEAFTLADCAAAPALFYANWTMPFTSTHPALGRYLERLLERPSFARAVEEARPYRHLFPLEAPAN
jgi:glutathione S-transferase